MEKEQKVLLCRIAAAAALLAAGLLVGDGALEFALLVAAYAIAGYDVLFEAVKNIFHGEIFDECFLMSLATLGAFAIGDYAEGAAVMIFYQLGELVSDLAVDRSRRSIAELMDIRPDVANAERGGDIVEVKPDEVAVGDIIVIKPGERVPIDGEIIEGSSSLDTSAITGESVVRTVSAGDPVVSGCVNGAGLLRVRTSKLFAESTVSRVLELVENASSRKAKSESFITRFAKVYTPAVVAGAALLALAPPLLFAQPWSVWINRALIFLVVSCPCALVISVPLTFFCGMGGASRHGILIKGANYLEALAKLKTAAFDKTGTLTEGVFEVSSVHPENIGRASLLDYAAAAELYSEHPIALSIKAARGAAIQPSRVSDVKEIAGRGVSASVDGKAVLAGSEKLLSENGINVGELDCGCAGTIVHVALEGEYIGHITISDRVKPEAKQALELLRGEGVSKTVMLTGDNEEVAQRVASELGVSEVYTGLLPTDKVAKVEALLAAEGAKETLAFVGDGINDAPVLARADVGIAMGALGSDAAIEAADVVLMDDDPRKIADAVAISRRTKGIVTQNIVFALAVKAAALTLGALGFATMWSAVFADVGVTVLAVLNATRAARFSPKR